MFILLFFAPILRYIPNNAGLVWILMASAYGLMSIKFKNKFFNIAVFVSITVLSFFGTLFASNIINSRGEVNWEQTIFGQKYFVENTREIARDALIFPYKLRKIVFSVYLGYAGEIAGRALGKIIGSEWLTVFTPLGTLAFYLGIYEVSKRYKFFLAVILGCLIGSGIPILIGSNSIFYFFIPIWLYASYIGIKKIGRKYMLALMLLNLLYVF